MQSINESSALIGTYRIILHRTYKRLSSSHKPNDEFNKLRNTVNNEQHKWEDPISDDGEIPNVCCHCGATGLDDRWTGGIGPRLTGSGGARDDTSDNMLTIANTKRTNHSINNGRSRYMRSRKVKPIHMSAPSHPKSRLCVIL